MRPILLSRVLLLLLMFSVFSPKLCRAQFADDFTGDTSLNSALWTNSTAQLTILANDFNSTLIAPILNFDATGMNYSGANTNLELAGIQSIGTFIPPFTLMTTVTAGQAHGNPFELLLVNSNVSEWVNISGNVDTANGKYFGVWVNFSGSGLGIKNLGNNLFSDPNTNSQYVMRIFLETNGVMAVSLLASNAIDLGVQTNLAVGNGPFYVILSQREGKPVDPGTNVATWKNFSLSSLAPAPVLAPPTRTNATLSFAWSAVAGATYQPQYSSSLSPAQWFNLGSSFTATNSLGIATDSPPANAPRFYRVVLMP